MVAFAHALKICALRLGLAAFFAVSVMAWPGSGHAQQLQGITIEVARLLSCGPTLIARDRGYFREEGLDADIKIFDSAQDGILAIAAGSVDTGSAAFTASFFNLAGKGAFKAFAGQGQEKPGYHNNALIATNPAWDAGLKNVSDLKGKRIGITTTGVSSQYILGVMLEKRGLKMSDVTLVPLQSNPNVVAAFKGGQIDAAVLASPLPIPMLADHTAHLIEWASDEGIWQVSAIFAGTAVIEKKRPSLEKYLRAYARGAVDYANAFNQFDKDGQPIKGPGYDEILDNVARDLAVPRAQLEASLPYVTPDGTLDFNDVKHQIAFWKANGFVGAGVDPDAIVDKSFGKVK